MAYNTSSDSSQPSGSAANETSGLIPFVWEGTTYQTWYKVIGDLNNPKAGRRPLVVVHGGPGWTHDYMLPHKVLHERHGIPLIFYDQLGNGKSSHVPDAAVEFWTPELLVDELNNVVKFLKIENNFDLLGNSWGGMLVGQYAATYTPPGLKHLIIGNSPATIPLLNEGFHYIVTQFPQDVRDVFNKYESDSSDPPLPLDTEEYKQAVSVFLKTRVFRLDPWPEELIKSAGAAQENPAVHVAMLGPYALRATGNIKNWTIEPIAHQISCPTLLFSSPDDEVQELSVKPWFLWVPKVKWVSFRNSLHFPFLEEPEKYFQIVYDFLEYST